MTKQKFGKKQYDLQKSVPYLNDILIHDKMKMWEGKCKAVAITGGNIICANNTDKLKKQKNRSKSSKYPYKSIL